MSEHEFRWHPAGVRQSVASSERTASASCSADDWFCYEPLLDNAAGRLQARTMHTEHLAALLAEADRDRTVAHARLAQVVEESPMSEHTPLTEAEVETLRDACNLSQRNEVAMNVCAVVERILAARTSTATADADKRLANALEEISAEATGKNGESILQPGAAYALGVLADLAKAGPGSSWADVAKNLRAATADTGLRERVEAVLYDNDGNNRMPQWFTDEVLAALDATPASTEDACTCPPDECHEAGAPGCYFGTASTEDRDDNERTQT